MSKQIKITDSTYFDLMELKGEDDTFNSVIRELMYENRRIKRENENLILALQKIK